MDHVLGYIKSGAQTMVRHNLSYFHFAWSTSLTHGTTDVPHMVDPLLLSFLHEMNNESYLTTRHSSSYLTTDRGRDTRP